VKNRELLRYGKPLAASRHRDRSRCGKRGSLAAWVSTGGFLSVGGITKSSKSWMTILIWKAMVLGYPHFRTSPSGAAETQKTVGLRVGHLQIFSGFFPSISGGSKSNYTSVYVLYGQDSSNIYILTLRMLCVHIHQYTVHIYIYHHLFIRFHMFSSHFILCHTIPHDFKIMKFFHRNSS
jgi:hypothetical protein